MVYSTDRSKEVVPVLVLIFVALWFILRGNLFHVVPCVILFFSPFSIAITSLEEERANFSAFRAFVRFLLVWICRFPLPFGVGWGMGCGRGGGRAAVCDCGTPWTFLLPFLIKRGDWF